MYDNIIYFWLTAQELTSKNRLEQEKKWKVSFYCKFSFQDVDILSVIFNFFSSVLYKIPILLYL